MQDSQNLPHDRRASGIEIFHRLHPDAAAKMQRELSAIAPEMVDLIAEFPFGTLYTRGGLEARIRQTSTIAALAAIGGADDQLKIHIQIGLNIGLQRSEIVEIFMQISAYAGFPRAINALMAAKSVFEITQQSTESNSGNRA